MTVYMNRLFRKSNSSFLLSSGKAIKSQVSRFKDDLYLLDGGIGSPKITGVDELRRVPNNHGFTRFENNIGFMNSTAGESLVKTQMLERWFMDIVAGEPAMKELAMAKFSDMVGPTDAVAGEPSLLLPRSFTQKLVWMELQKMSQSHKKVRGFLIERVKGGYTVAIAGYIVFLPFRSFIERRNVANDKYFIETLNPKTKRITVG